MNARALPLAIAVALGISVPVAGRAATLPVTSCADDDSVGTLRAEAMTAQDGDTIDMTQLTCSTITLAQGPIDTSVFGPHPVNSLTLAGPGQNALTISGGGDSAVFFVGTDTDQSTFTARDLTIAHGAKYDAPACIFASSSRVVLDHVTVTDCHSIQTNWFRGGGAIGAWELYLTDSTISDSSVTASGQGIATGGGAWTHAATIVRSTISGNRVIASGLYGYPRAQTAGGGIYASFAMTVIDSTIAGNSAEATGDGRDAIGGGLAAHSTITVSGSTFTGNTADGAGGALSSISTSYPDIPSSGFFGPLATNSTFTGNSARIGGAIFSAWNAVLSNDTIAGNTTAEGGAVIVAHGGTDTYAYSLYLDSTIIAGNMIDGAGGHAADLGASPNLTLTVIGANNLVGAADPAIVLPPDTIAGVDPRLLPLADNGGLTWTMALTPGSPAIDTGSNPDFLDTDQRGQGYLRVFGPAADIGAYEVQSAGEVIFVSGFDD